MDRCNTTPSVNTPSKLKLDNTELYDSTGRTVIDIQDMEPKEILRVLEVNNE